MSKHAPERLTPCLSYDMLIRPMEIGSTSIKLNGHSHFLLQLLSAEAGIASQHRKEAKPANLSQLQRSREDSHRKHSACV